MQLRLVQKRHLDTGIILENNIVPIIEYDLQSHVHTLVIKDEKDLKYTADRKLLQQNN